MHHNNIKREVWKCELIYKREWERERKKRNTYKSCPPIVDFPASEKLSKKALYIFETCLKSFVQSKKSTK